MSVVINGLVSPLSSVVEAPLPANVGSTLPSKIDSTVLYRGYNARKRATGSSKPNQRMNVIWHDAITEKPIPAGLSVIENHILNDGCDAGIAKTRRRSLVQNVTKNIRSAE